MYNKVLMGYIAVDSGQVMICDPCYIDSQWEREEDGKESTPDRFNYSSCAKATLSGNGFGELKFKRGHIGAGIALGTPYGDGMYAVYGNYNEENVLVSVIIDFAE